MNRLRSCENDRIDDSLSSWVWRATRLFLISSLVTPRLAYAVSMNELLVSMIVARSGPVPSNAVPSSSMTVRRSPLSTLLTNESRSTSSSVAASGVLVSSRSIVEPSRR